MDKKDTARLEELLARVWAHQARAILRKDKDPDEIFSSEVESHGGRKDKALRLLKEAGALRFSRTGKAHWGAEISIYKILDFDKSQRLGVAPPFITTWKEYHDDLFGWHRDYDDEFSFETVGYKNIGRGLSDAEALYVYWHQDDYAIQSKEDNVEVYPKALQETRAKSILRAAVEEHFQSDFTHKLEKYISLPADSLKPDNKFEVEVRNYAHFAGFFSKEQFEGALGFLKEYEHYRKYFDAIIHGMTSIMERVRSAGGYEALIRQMRKDSIQSIYESCPLHITYEDEKDVVLSGEDNRNAMIKPSLQLKWTCRFILRHADWFDYDTLYGTDESLEQVSKVDGHATYADGYVFTPDEDELKVIAQSEKERTVCTMNLISKISAATSVPATES